MKIGELRAELKLCAQLYSAVWLPCHLSSFLWYPVDEEGVPIPKMKVGAQHPSYCACLPFFGVVHAQDYVRHADNKNIYTMYGKINL